MVGCRCTTNQKKLKIHLLHKMAFKVITEQFIKKKSDFIKAKSLPFAYGPAINKTSLAEDDPAVKEDFAIQQTSTFLEEKFLLPVHLVLILSRGQQWNFHKLKELL